MMKQTTNYKLTQILFFALITAFAFASCNKDLPNAETDLSYKMLADRTWYLVYSQTINGATVNQKTYIGQSTYFINFVNNLTLNDSDGLTGTYTVQKINNQLQIQVNAKTTKGSVANFTYDVLSLGMKNMILSYTTGSTTTKLYYNLKN